MKKILNEIVRFFTRMADDRVGALAAQAAYFVVLSFVPTMIILLAIIPRAFFEVNDVIQAVTEIVPQEFESMVTSVIREAFTKSSTAVPISLLVTLWSAGRAINVLSGGLNDICHVDKVPNFLLVRLRSTLYTLLFVIALSLAMVITVFGATFAQTLARYFPQLSFLSWNPSFVKTLLMLTALLLIFLLLYKFVPSRKASWKSQLPGAMIAAASWIIFSWGFSFYYERSTGISNMYGSLTTIVMVLLWMYCCMYIIFIGAEINEVYGENFKALYARFKRTLRKISPFKKSSGSDL